MPPAQSRNWCFTINNWTEEDLRKISDYHRAHPATYIIYGKEVGEEGTPHLQGYIHFKTSQKPTAMNKVSTRSRNAMCLGTPADNIKYCKKEGDFTCYGEEPVTQQDANKQKAARFITLAKAGDFATIEDEMPALYVSRYRTMHEIATAHMVKPPNLEECCGIWIYGESGSGKTTSARTEYGDYYCKSANKWWDGYQGEDTVIIEDLDPNHKCLAHHLKLWMDKWSFPAEVKGGMRCLRPQRVIITSQYSIEEVFRDEPATVAAITRRCKVIHMHKSLNYERRVPAPVVTGSSEPLSPPPLSMELLSPLHLSPLSSPFTILETDDEETTQFIL